MIDDQHNYDSVESKMARGAVWLIGMRWTIRAIGLINTIILARLLTPQDFGIVAMATVVIGLFNYMTDLSVDTALLRDQAGARARYDSAWTLQVLSGLLKTGIFIGTAPLLADYYGDPRVENVVYIMAIGAAIAGFENIGQVEFRRELRFDTEFFYWVYRRIITFVLTLGVVFWLRSYLALALALPINSIVTVILSFWMSSYRPRFAIKFIPELWAFSKWLILLGITRFFSGRGEPFVLGRLTTANVVGEYAVSAEFGLLITQEFVVPAGRALLPGYSKISGDKKQLRKVFGVSFSLLTAISLAVGVGASFLSENIILVLLGNQWRNAVPLFQWLALHAAFLSIVQSMHPYFLVTKRERLLSLCYLVYVAILIPAIVIAAFFAEVETVASTRALITCLFLLGMLGVLIRIRAFSLTYVFAITWRPLLATTFMALALMLSRAPDGDFLSLIINVVVGGSTFLCSLFLLWIQAGRPSGAESAILAFARREAAVVRKFKRWLEQRNLHLGT